MGQSNPVLACRSHPSHITKLLCGAMAFLSMSSVAQQDRGLVTNIDVNYASLDNVFRNTENINDNKIRVAPSVSYDRFYGDYGVKAHYRGDYNIFNDNDDLSYYDHDLSMGANFIHSSRLASEFIVGYRDNVELPGSNNALATPITEFNQTSGARLHVKGVYGTRESVGQMVVSYDFNQFKYDNNDQSLRNFDLNSVTSAFYYNATAKLRWLIEVSASDHSYNDNELIDISSTQLVVLGGVEWLTTAKTTSVFKIGYQDADYKTDDVDDISGLSYLLDFYWDPSSRSRLRLAASRVTREPANIEEGGYLSDRYQLEYQYDFTALTQLTVELAHTNEDFNNDVERNDEFQEAKVKLSYSPKYWLDVYAGYEMTKRSSDQAVFEFDNSEVQLGVKFKFE